MLSANVRNRSPHSRKWGLMLLDIVGGVKCIEKKRKKRMWLKDKEAAPTKEKKRKEKPSAKAKKKKKK